MPVFQGLTTARVAPGEFSDAARKFGCTKDVEWLLPFGETLAVKPPNHTYGIAASIDLVNWRTLTNVTSATERIPFTDAEAANLPRRRAVMSYFGFACWRGFTHLNPRNRAKSLSFECNSHWCSIAKAARCASVATAKD